MAHINQGKSFNLFKLVTVTDSAFPDDAQVVINFRGQKGLSLTLYGTDPVEYSTNGNVVEGDMRAGTPTEQLVFIDRRISKLWLRLKSGSSSEVRIEAWG